MAIIEVKNLVKNFPYHEKRRVLKIRLRIYLLGKD
ncbi:MAG: hypothetical protein UT18_C0009G0054 [candidate division CPR2 bacterium GW2011_GWC2_39_10]|uniref:Uncharacterized protein n=1 Tax=candidate division CPR2 bacterium GW2011_GWC2_39_10 TaxID=1618345 RepID=A0A0G0LRV9_UNCC2|nr:MAG: hypothetical protein UT18_C0009G0054 [candidate division CPR2 bacterium GW2011_GWC2_39_10]